VLARHLLPDIEEQADMAFSAASKGLYAIATTPFLEDGSIDFASIDRLTEFYEGCGCTGITVLGIMGEAPKLEAEESRAIVQRVVSRATVPVIVGVSAPGFAAMRSLTRASMDLGAAGVMIAPPPALRTDDQIVTYFADAVEAIGENVPWVLQDYPLTLTVVMTPGVIAKIMTNHQSCLMLKHEDWPGLEKISRLRALQKAGDLRPFSILCGNGALLLDFEAERGADGAMTGYGFPDMLTELVDMFAAGRRDEAHDLFDAHLPLIRYEQQMGIGLAVRKHVLKRRGVIATDAQRKPAQMLSATAKAEVDYLLMRLARYDKRAAV
jgi:4-hydroxy-tetrahydrodipicolinate synthase